MSLSIVSEIRRLQREAGPGRCAICLRLLKRKPGGGRMAFACWSADCRAELEAARGRFKTGLRGAVISIGDSADALAQLVGSGAA